MTKVTNNCYLDANVLVYYKNEDSPFFEKAKKLIEELLKQDSRLFVSPLVLDEFLFQFQILLRNKRVKRNKLFTLLDKALRDILDLPNLFIVNLPSTKKNQLKILSFMNEFGLRPRDSYHLLTMLENNIHFFVTFDNDFKAVFKQRILFPITSK